MTRAKSIQVVEQLRLREREKFLYKYDFADSWKHQIHIKAISYPEQQPEYPACLGGKQAAPPECCGSSWAMRKRYEEICQIHDQLNPKDFDPAKINHRLE